MRFEKIFLFKKVYFYRLKEKKRASSLRNLPFKSYLTFIYFYGIDFQHVSFKINFFCIMLEIKKKDYMIKVIFSVKNFEAFISF